ncbi:hypothetical protein MXAN_3481 [Myxococcus xanthus DK 1622]|uniref:Uncharacterized protein n=2 Tax=Myxococcaceae TaxID=31 RepID=Q1D6P7_MYXXD|nr:hypothetical protein MXAN_3481 [Myxococcus xanthus DK 1622]NOJ52000.1 hypothetical protein [Myxococcus xanthus]QPM82903.1 hypothetical protein I5Q59_17230 [Myxococcus xanthus]QVW65209.1 hypothetical protein JTM82_22575 [Myxococcus xanthus DZ2]UEO01723.1 hypothetical protein K1515_20215 [Myxococcus xanthus DZ2]
MTPRRLLVGCGVLASLLGADSSPANEGWNGDVAPRLAPNERGEPRRPGAPRKKGWPMLTRVPLSRLKVTEGSLEPGPGEQLLVDGPRMRAIVPESTTSDVALRFTLLGPTERQVALASGEQRQQVGLKLFAVDACNVLYAMWRLAPKPGIVVNFKRNPGQHTSRECGNRGYTLLHPEQHVRLEAPSTGEPHTLRAQFDGKVLRVWADDTLAWTGEVPEEALAPDAPVGLRSDNVRLSLQLSTPPP